MKIDIDRSSYTKKEYAKYVKSMQGKVIKSRGKDYKIEPCSFEEWRHHQPIADMVLGTINQVIKGEKK